MMNKEINKIVGKVMEATGFNYDMVINTLSLKEITDIYNEHSVIYIPAGNERVSNEEVERMRKNGIIVPNYDEVFDEEEHQKVIEEYKEKLKYAEYKVNIKEIVGDDYNSSYEGVNKDIYEIYKQRKGGDISVFRGSGTSISIMALANTFDDVLFIDFKAMNERYNRNVDGKVVFIDEGIDPRMYGKPACVYKIVSTGKF